MKRVLTVASPWLGGSGSVAYRLSKTLAKNNYEVHFLSFDLPFKAVSKNKTGIKFHKVKEYNYQLFPFALKEMALIESIVDLVKEKNIRIVHAHYITVFGHAAILAKEILKSEGIDIKVILTFHGTDVIGFDVYHPGKIIAANLTNWAIKNADAVTTVSLSIKSYLESIYKVERTVEVIPNFVDLQDLPASVHAKEPVILHISNFRKVKQPLLLLKIFKKVKEKVPNAKLILLGEGPELATIQEEVIKNSFEDVHCVGKVIREEDLNMYYRNSKVYLLPSIFESFSLTALEAQTNGLPVVASNVGGIPEVVKDGETGFLIDSNDINKFAQKVILLLQDQDLWQSMSANCISLNKKFSTNKVIKQYEQVMDRLLIETDEQFQPAKFENEAFLVN